MLEFKQDDTGKAIIVTLTELVSIPTPNYLFVFTHVTTKDVVAFVELFIDDESAFPDRYNQFTINPLVLFAGYQPGEWHYKIYEQADASNLDPELSGAVLEYGKMYLDRATDFAYDMYDTATTYKTYNG